VNLSERGGKKGHLTQIAKSLPRWFSALSIIISTVHAMMEP